MHKNLKLITDIHSTTCLIKLTLQYNIATISELENVIDALRRHKISFPALDKRSIKTIIPPCTNTQLSYLQQSSIGADLARRALKVASMAKGISIHRREREQFASNELFEAG
jgi:hypothetical protein